MAGPKQIPEPWRSFLEELDQRATEETRMDCMGGCLREATGGWPTRVVSNRGWPRESLPGIPLAIGRPAHPPAGWALFPL